jgi:uncharacterized protein (UPF0248 family)
MGECRHCVPEKAFAPNLRLMAVPYPREILNRLRWKDGSLDDVRVTYVHRGAPGDVLTIPAENIVKLGHSFFATADSEIPYHRIILIERRGEVLFDIKEFENKDNGTT